MKRRSGGRDERMRGRERGGEVGGEERCREARGGEEDTRGEEGEAGGRPHLARVVLGVPFVVSASPVRGEVLLVDVGRDHAPLLARVALHPLEALHHGRRERLARLSLYDLPSGRGGSGRDGALERLQDIGGARIDVHLRRSCGRAGGRGRRVGSGIARKMLPVGRPGPAR